jgi:YVTN family beta-propeller protein
MNGYVWTVNHQGASITKVRADGTIIGTYGVGSYPGSITNDGTYVYTANFGSSNISKVDAATGSVVATFPLEFSPTAITYDGSYLWVGATGSGIRKVDPANGNILLSAGNNLPGCCGSITGLMVANGGLWGNDYSGGKVVKFSLTDGAVIDQVTVDASGPLASLFAGGHLWVTIGAASKLLRF